MPRMDTRSQ